MSAQDLSLSSTEDLTSLISLGFDPAISAYALARNRTIEEAVNWILENKKISPEDVDSSDTENEIDFSLKMVMVVRTDLGMSAGKIAAQCVHAALGAYRETQAIDPRTLRMWEETGEKAVALRAKNEEELNALQLVAQVRNIPNYVVIDAGRTQIAEGSKTVLAIGPAHEDIINEVTGRLKLY